MARPSATTQLNTWDAALAKAAVVATKAEARSLDRPWINMGSGQMSIAGAAIPNSELGAIVLADIHANLYYPDAYDANNPVPPDCYAFARVNDEGELEGVDTWNGKTEMAPHKDCHARQCDTCAACPLNQFGSAGKGKACQNTRRLALIPGGTMIGGRFEAYTKPEQIADAQLLYLKLPVMSVKGFAAYIVQVAGALARPLWAVFSKLKRVPNPSSQYTVQWEALGTVPNALMEAVFKRHQDAVKDICFPYQPKAENVAPLNTRPKAKRKYS